MKINTKKFATLNLKNPKQSGIGLLEVLISMSLALAIIVTIIIFQNYILNQQNFISDSYITMNIANNAVQQMTKEIRNVQDSDNGAYALEILNDQEIVFYSNVDSQSDIEKVKYSLQGSNLIKTITKPTTYPITYPSANDKTITIAENVVNSSEPIFYYYNSQYPDDQINNPLILANRATQTRLIAIKLIININEKVLKQNYLVQSYAQIRILKDNL